MVDKQDLRQQFLEAFEGANYPVSNPMDLVPALPDGPSTEFESGEFAMTALELNAALGDVEFPYDTPEGFVDDVMEGLEEQGLI